MLGKKRSKDFQGWGEETPTLLQDQCSTGNKTGSQPAPRPVEQVHNFGRWGEGAKSLWCQGYKL